MISDIEYVHASVLQIYPIPAFSLQQRNFKLHAETIFAKNVVLSAIFPIFPIHVYAEMS